MCVILPTFERPEQTKRTVGLDLFFISISVEILERMIQLINLGERLTEQKLFVIIHLAV